MDLTSLDDIDMPDALCHYWRMWNEPNVELVRGHLELAVSDDVLFVDPLHNHVGKDALEANVRTLRTENPDFFFVMASEFDGHNNRYRYRWNVVKKGRVLLKGFDVTTINAGGKVERIDGFFGELAML